MSPSIDEVVSACWPGERVGVSPLAGGITNTNYRVDVGGDSYVVRLVGERTDLLGIDRASELDACRVAASLGVGPELVTADVAAGIVVTRFVEGTAIALSEVGEEPVVAEVATALRRVHAAGSVAATFDPFRLVPDYRRLAEENGVRPPFDYEAMWQALEAIAVARPFAPTCLCHNDLLNSNLLRTTDGVRIVDWEYAGMGDPFFDLGNLAVNHGFGEQQEVALLRYYFGEAGEAARAALRLFELVSEAREAMWGVLQTGISRLEVDFVGYAGEHAAGFFAMLAELDFTESLRLAAGAPARAQERTRSFFGS